jgi:hypothetical protein
MQLEDAVKDKWAVLKTVTSYMSPPSSAALGPVSFIALLNVHVHCRRKKMAEKAIVAATPKKTPNKPVVQFGIQVFDFHAL